MDILIEIMNFVFNFLMGMLLIHAMLLLMNHRKEREKADDEVQEKIKSVGSVLSASKPVYIERHADQYLMFDSLKNTFLCQSNTLEGLAESCHKYAKINLAIVKFDKDFFLFREGKVIREGQEMEIKV